jgi:Leu/Phe-tRNA-protein transferase
MIIIYLKPMCNLTLLNQWLSEFKIISANCQGLHDFKKRKEVLQYYRQLQCIVLCLQDIHFTDDMKSWIKAKPLNITN